MAIEQSFRKNIYMRLSLISDALRRPNKVVVFLGCYLSLKST